MGDRIRISRERAGLSKSALGRAVGVSHQAVMEWEKGNVDKIAAVHVLNIARATGDDYEYLLTGRRRQKPGGTAENQADYSANAAVMTATRALENLDTRELELVLDAVELIMRALHLHRETPPGGELPPPPPAR